MPIPSTLPPAAPSSPVGVDYEDGGQDKGAQVSTAAPRSFAGCHSPGSRGRTCPDVLLLAELIARPPNAGKGLVILGSRLAIVSRGARLVAQCEKRRCPQLGDLWHPRRV